MDKYDDCPDIAGEVQFKGCPDRDHDGIMDLDDKCPLDFGTKELKGCPDKDDDGIGDGEDLCPDKKGSATNKGCPDDTDGDGVYDDDDKCPEVAGEKENKGCPNEDSDKDGVFDKEDECVYTPGSAQNNGCPLLTTEDLEIINSASEKLSFFDNTTEINPTSFVFLENLANWMNNNTYANLSLSSHTDNEGPEVGRIQISKERAESVKQFLINKNVSPLKINYEYFGSTKPIADNNTIEGRKRNNRIEFKIKFK
jgi:outer membrane protein OmpA-like peptidoglycan-associated protein